MDDKIEKINQKIARLLGKKVNDKPNFNNNHDDEEGIGGGVYFFITVICFISLWISTGVYYINDGYYGVVVTNGSVKQVITGPKIGITLPQPLANVQIIDSMVTEMKPLTIDGLNETNYKTLTQDNISLVLQGYYAFQIADPLKIYNTLVLDKLTIENTVRLNILSILHTFIANQSYANLHTANLTIISNQIRQQTNKNLANYGITITKININKITALDITKGLASGQVNTYQSHFYYATNVANKLISEAKQYQINQLAQTKASIETYNILYPQYKKNPLGVAKQMYFDTIAASLDNTQHDQYELLFLSLSNLLNYATNDKVAGEVYSDNSNRGFLEREVLRERIFGR
ncbi:MAG: hypothetical protein K2P99_05330 [Burkholderiales bacterium]|nr:hypothetical protein [Burkholderiales bacterium]